MNKFYFFILLESESAHHRPGRLHAGYTELLHIGPSYGTSQVAQLTPTHPGAFQTSLHTPQPTLLYKGSYQFQESSSNSKHSIKPP